MRWQQDELEAIATYLKKRPVKRCPRGPREIIEDKKFYKGTLGNTTLEIRRGKPKRPMLIEGKRYSCAGDAAKAHRISVGAVVSRIHRGVSGWQYADGVKV